MGSDDHRSLAAARAGRRARSLCSFSSPWITSPVLGRPPRFTPHVLRDRRAAAARGAAALAALNSRRPSTSRFSALVFRLGCLDAASRGHRLLSAAGVALMLANREPANLIIGYTLVLLPSLRMAGDHRHAVRGALPLILVALATAMLAADGQPAASHHHAPSASEAAGHRAALGTLILVFAVFSALLPALRSSAGSANPPMALACLAGCVLLKQCVMPLAATTPVVAQALAAAGWVMAATLMPLGVLAGFGATSRAGLVSALVAAQLGLAVAGMHLAHPHAASLYAVACVQFLLFLVGASLFDAMKSAELARPARPWLWSILALALVGLPPALGFWTRCLLATSALGGGASADNSVLAWLSALTFVGELTLLGRLLQLPETAHRPGRRFSLLYPRRAHRCRRHPRRQPGPHSGAKRSAGDGDKHALTRRQGDKIRRQGTRRQGTRDNLLN